MASPLISFTLLLFSLHHFSLSLCTLCLNLLRALLHAHLGLLQICGISSMCAILAVPAFRTEAAEVERA
jgi:hypothetical protein